MIAYVIRHGANAANQGPYLWDVVGTVDLGNRRRLPTGAEYVEIKEAWIAAHPGLSVYNNQHVSIETKTWCRSHRLSVDPASPENW